MPNWCYNSATLTHSDKTKIDALEEELKKQKSQPFQHLCPNPSGEWDYGWSCDNWGSKWDAQVSDYEREDDHTIVMHFDTAWSPPIALYEYLSNEEWGIQALYHEPGMGFAGKFEDGFDDYYEYDYTNRDDVENLPEDIADFTNAMDDLEQWESEQQAEEEENAYLETVTYWYPVDVNPHYQGFYETKEGNWPFYKFAHWNGKKWTVDGKKPKFKIDAWRGLNEDPAILTEENAADTLDNMMKDLGFEKVEEKINVI
jgi:hypothetical protein